MTICIMFVYLLLLVMRIYFLRIVFLVNMIDTNAFMFVCRQHFIYKRFRTCFVHKSLRFDNYFIRVDLTVHTNVLFLLYC